MHRSVLTGAKARGCVRSLDELLPAAATSRSELPVLVCAQAADRSALQAVRRAIDAGLVRAVLVGDATRITALASATHVSLDDVQLLDVQDEEAACRCAVAMCRSGDADLLMKGAVPTAKVLNAALDPAAGLRAGRLLSHVAVFEPPALRRLMLLTDAAVNVAPDADATAEIASTAIWLAHQLGMARPRVALLAASEKVSVRNPATGRARDMAWRLQQQHGQSADVEGPLSLDLAVSAHAVAQKQMDPRGVAGQADILVAPDIAVANVLYKSLTFFGSSEVASIVLGATTPLVVPSRGDSVRSMVLSIALAVVSGPRGEGCQ